jgi:hypothetical protein
MRTTKIFILLAAALTLACSALLAGVSVSTNEPTEKLVALRVFGNGFIATQTGGYFQDPCPTKLSNRAKFTLIDLTGGTLADGHKVRISYLPGNSPKPNFWIEVADGIKRASDGDTFTIHRVDGKCALETVTGRFVGAPMTNGLLSVTSKLNRAMLFEVVDLSSLPPGQKTVENPKDLPILTIAPSPESSTNQPPATAQSKPPSPASP